jgi:type I restriction enzyme S subunit
MTGNKIPKHWQKASLGKILTISSGNGLTKSKRNDEGEYLVYGGNGVTGKHSEFLFEEEKLIIGRVGVHCGNAYITKPKSWVTDNAFVVSFDETEININFLLNLIGILNLNKYSVSTAQPVISQGKLYPIEVAIPPLLEQQAIVAKIEELLSELENGKQQLQTAQQQLKMYRQSLLKWAFEGKLTNKKVKDGELPKGWKLKELKEITSVLGDGLHGTPKYSETGDYYFINGNNLNDGKIEIKENTKRVSLEEYNKYKKPLNENTIFVSINGSLGYTAFYNNEKVILGKSACYFNVLETINKFYIRYFLTSRTTTHQKRWIKNNELESNSSQTYRLR